MKQRSQGKKSRRGSNIPRQIGAGDIILKKMTLSSQSIATTAGSIIAVTTSVTSSLVQSAPAAEWASFAARYQQYRVKSVRIRCSPCFPACSTPAVGTGHSQLYVSDYIGTGAPTSAAQVLSDESSSCHSTSKSVSYTASSRRNPNALLWNPTTAAIPAANQFGISWASSTVATMMAAATPYFSYDVEWVVEFRGSQ